MNDRDRILPRFWSIRDKEYIYWDCYMQTAFNRLIEPNTYGLMYKLYKDRVNYIPEMPTGLRDKNGKLIYEGDVLKCVYSEIMQYRVYWEGRGYRMRVYGSDNKIVDDCPIFIHAADVLEIIGNIHENADLLEVGGK